MQFFLFGYEDPAESNAESTESNVDPNEIKKFSQNDLNKIDMAEKKKRIAAEAELKKMQEIVTQLQSQHNMSESEKAELAEKLEELERAKMSEQERRAHEEGKLKRQFEAREKELSEQLAAVTRNRDELVITRAIKDLAIAGDIVAADGTGNQVLAVLKYQAQVNEQGEVIIKNFEYTDEDEKTLVGDLPVAEAIEKMKSMKAWANFWRDPSKKGYVGPLESDSLPGTFKLKDFDSYQKARAKGEVPWLKRK